MKIIKIIICWLKGHKRGETWSRTGYVYYDQRGPTHWHIKCARCEKRADYYGPRARLVAKELELGFDGN